MIRSLTCCAVASLLFSFTSLAHNDHQSFADLATFYAKASHLSSNAAELSGTYECSMVGSPDSEEARFHHDAVISKSATDLQIIVSMVDDSGFVLTRTHTLAQQGDGDLHAVVNAEEPGMNIRQYAPGQLILQHWVVDIEESRELTSGAVISRSVKQAVASYSMCQKK